MGEKLGWALSRRAFQRLVSWLDAEGDASGQGYLTIRRRLVWYFDRRNCAAADELADEVLNRVARRLEEEGAIDIEAPAKYCYVVARFVLMEHRREQQRTHRLADDIRLESSSRSSSAAEEADRQEKMLACLERCAARLEPAARELIETYYAGTGRAKIESRRSLAERLGITVNALSIRACRIRDRLYDCVSQCLSGR